MALNQWLKAQEKGQFPSLGSLALGDGAELCSKPAAHCVKTNVDAAIYMRQ